MTNTEVVAAESVEQVTATRPRRSALKRFLRQPSGVFGAVILFIVLCCAVFAEWIAPESPPEQHLEIAFQGPSAEHWFGTDQLGRDVLSLLVFGCRLAVIAVCIAACVAFLIGLPAGIAAGYFRGKVDRIVTFCGDGIMSMPGLLLAIAITGMLGPSLRNSMLAVGLVESPRVARLTRNVVLGIRVETYVEASVVSGASAGRIIWGHIVPNIRAPLIVFLMGFCARVVVVEASLSFLGLGVQYPQVSWGSMIAAATDNLDRDPYLVYFPGFAVVLFSLSLYLIGDAIRESFGAGG